MSPFQPWYSDLSSFHAVTFARRRSGGLGYTEEAGGLLRIGMALRVLRILRRGVVRLI